MKPQKSIATITALNVFLSSISSSYAMIRGDKEKEDGLLSDYRPDNRLHASSAHAAALPDGGPSSPVHLRERESRIALTPLEAPSSVESPYAAEAASSGWDGVVLVDPDSIASAEIQESWEERQKRDAQIHEDIQSRRVYEEDERLAQQLSMELNNAPQQRNGIADKDLDWKHSEDMEPNRGSYLYDDDGEERKADYVPDDHPPTPSAHAAALPDERPASPAHRRQNEFALILLEEPSSKDTQVHEATQRRRYEDDERLARQLSMELNNAPQQRNGIAGKGLDWKHSEDMDPNRSSCSYDDDGEERKADYIPVHPREGGDRVFAHHLGTPSPLSAQMDFIDRELDSFRDEVIQKTRARQDTITPLVQKINGLVPATSPGVKVKLKTNLPSLVPAIPNRPVIVQALQPAALTLPSFRESFLRDLNPPMSHFFLSPLMVTLEEINTLLRDPLMQGIPIALELANLANLYQEAAQKLCKANRDERHDLLSLVRLRLERSPHSYFISEPMAYKILSSDELGLVRRVNEMGSTAVMPFNGLHFKRNFKKARSEKGAVKGAVDYYKILQDDNLTFEGTLDPGMEWSMYAFYTLLMGGGVTPSSLVVLQNVPQLVPKEGTRPYELLANILYPPNSEGDKKKALSQLPSCLLKMDDFTRNLKEHAVQVSRTVPGVDLAAFLTEGSQNFDPQSFSAMMLASLLTAASDAKGDNFIVMQKDGKGAIVGIDNDAALGPFIARHICRHPDEQKASHAQSDVPPASKYSYTVEARNILFCLHDWMGKSVDQTIQQRLLDISPHAFVVEWLSLLKEQNNRYISLTTEGKLHPVTFRNLYLPLRIQAGSLTHLTNNIVRLQEALRLDSSLTHQAAFELLSPVSALYYQEMAGHYGKDPLACFPPIYNQHKPVEKALDLQQQLKDGRTIEEALESEKYSKGGASNRHQVLSEGIQSLLETTDLTDLEEKTKAGFLKAAFQYFPNQTRRVHSSWKDPHLVHEAIRHQAPLPLLGCLIDKNPDALVDEGIGDSLLHTAIRYENSQTSAYTPFLLEKGVSLESLNSQYLTPLDLAMSLRNEHLFSMLVGLGAGKRANVTIAMKFFKALGEDSPAREAFNHLLGRNQEIAWHVTLNDILPPVSKGSEGLVVQTATLGERRLVLHDQLFDEKGAIRPSVKNGRHKVGSVDQKGGSILYFKEYPELPGLEEAVGILTRRIMGVGAPFTELAKIHNRPFLISQGIQGNLLSSVLKGTPHILKQLDPESLSAMIVMAILTNPEDGKPDNYIVERLPGNNNTYRLIGIDNDHAFVPAVAKEKKSVFSRADPIVQVKTILYCLDQMNDKVHSSVQEKIKALNAGTVLEEWIRALRPRNSLYRQLFPTGERGDALAHNSYLSVPFQKGAIGRLYQKIVRLQDFLGHNPNLTHMELLSKIEPQLAHRYRQGFKKPMSVKERFMLIDAPFYHQDSDGHHHTISKSGDILWSMDIPLKESLLEIARKQDAKEDDYQPNMALKELKAIRKNYGNLALLQNLPGAELLQSSGTLKGLFPDQLMRLVKNIDFASLSVSQRDAILETLKGKEFTQLTLLNASSLTNRLLMADIPLEKLLSINLSGAERLTPEILPAFAGRSIGLEYLKLAGLPRLTAFAEPGRFKNYPLVFPNLKSLYLDKTAITGIYVQAPLLEVLSAQQCPQLETLSVEVPLLKEAFLGNNPALSFEVLSSLLTGCRRLSTLEIKNCVKIGINGIKLPFEEENVKKAFGYFKEVTRSKDAIIQFNLGMMYASGQGVENNEEEAIRWYTLSANQGNANAQSILNLMRENGRLMENRTRLLEAVTKVPARRLADVCNNARSLFTDSMSGEDRSTILNAVAHVPDERLVDVCKNARSIFTEQMNGLERSNLLEAASQISVELLEKICNSARFLFTDGMSGEDKFKLLLAAAKIPPERLFDVCTNACSFFTNGMNGHGRASLLEVMVKIPAERLVDVCDSARSLFTDGMSEEERARLLKAAAKIPAERLVDVCDNARSLFTDGMSEGEKARLLKAAAKVPAERLVDVCDNARSLFTDGMSEEERARLLEAAARIPAGQWQEVSNNARSLFTSGMNGWDKARLLEAAGRIPTGRWQEVCTNARSLFTDGMSEEEKARLLKAAAKIPAERLVDVCDNARSLFTDGMSEEERARLLEAAARIPAGQWQEVSNNARSLFTSGMNGWDKARLLEAAGRVPTGRWQEVCTNARSLFTGGMSEGEKARLLKAAAKIRAEGLVDVCDNARSLFTDGMSEEERARLLEAAARIPAGQWQEVSNNARSLFTSGMNGWDKARLLEAAGRIPTGRWQEVCTNARSLFTDGMSEGERARLLEAAGRIPTGRWQEVCSNACSFFTTKMGTVSRANLLEAIANVPAERLVDVCDNARPLFTDDIDGEDRANLLEAIANVPAERLVDVCDNARFLFNGMSRLDRARLLEAAAHVPAEHLSSLCDNVPFLFNGMSGWDRTNLLQAAAQIPIERLEEVCNNARSLFTDGMSGEDRASLLQAMAEVPSERLFDVCNNTRSLCTNGMSGLGRSSLLQAVAKVPLERWKDIFNNARSLFTKKMDGWDRANILEATSKIPAEGLSDVCNNARFLFTDGMSGTERASLLEVAAEVPIEQWQEVCDHARSLFTDIMSGGERASLLEAATQVPDGRWQEVFNNARSLFTDGMNGWDKASLLQAAIQVPDGRWQEVCNNARSLFTNGMNGWDKARLLEAAAKVSPEHWVNACNKARSLFTEKMDGYERARLLEAAAKVLPEHWDNACNKAHSLFTFSENMDGKEMAELIEKTAAQTDQGLVLIPETFGHPEEIRYSE